MHDMQFLCFRFIDLTNSLQPNSVAVLPGLCLTWSETPNTGFLEVQLIFLTRESCEIKSYLISQFQNSEYVDSVKVHNKEQTAN